MLKLLVLFLALAFAADPAEAGAKRKRVAKHPTSAPTGLRHEGPRMIEVRPGYWISNWGCFTDDGYGRIASCDGRDSTD